MFHLFIKVINTEIGTKHFIQSEANNSVFSPIADDRSVRCRVSPAGWRGSPGETACAALQWKRYAGICWRATVVI